METWLSTFFDLLNIRMNGVTTLQFSVSLSTEEGREIERKLGQQEISERKNKNTVKMLTTKKLKTLRQ